jgi:predicted protein tyrosine phosphatase
MIVPYMSIDLFFIAAPFLCTSDRERRLLSKRIATCIVLGGICFLLFPLRFAFNRPLIGGWLGLLFNNFRALDMPFNQFPSLHIGLTLILASLYMKHTRGLARLVTLVWFWLIGLSAILTYQHHVIDVAGGLVLGALCLYVWDEQPFFEPVIRNERVGMLYISGAAICATFAYIARPWCLILIWPALALFIVGLAYFCTGAGVFRKRNGRLSIFAQIFLAPVLIGHRFSLLYYSRQSEAWNMLTDEVWIGRKLSSIEARRAIALGVATVIDLAVEFSEALPFQQINYVQLSTLDLTAPTAETLNRATRLICESAARGIVYIHCKAGYSRTAAVAGAYLLATGIAANPKDAIALLRKVRPSIVIRPEVERAIHDFFQRSVSAEKAMVEQTDSNQALARRRASALTSSA